eukprot:991493_1
MQYARKSSKNSMIARRCGKNSRSFSEFQSRSLVYLVYVQIMGAAIRISTLFTLIALPVKLQFESDIAQSLYHMAEASCCYKQINKYLQASPENTDAFKKYLQKSFQLNNFEFWESSSILGEDQQIRIVKAANPQSRISKRVVQNS